MNFKLIKSRHHQKRRLAALFAMALIPVLMSQAQNYDIDWFRIGGGGGVITNGPYSITGNIDQSQTGVKMAGGNFSLESGFWQAFTLVQTSGSPVLVITRTGAQSTIRWDQAVTGFVLESTSSLAAPANWQPVTGVSNNSVDVSNIAGRMFFRLRQGP